MTNYRILVTDNFHFMDESEDVTIGPFFTAEDALAKAQSIVDEFLIDEAKPGVSASALLDQWVSFGECPTIMCDDPKAAPLGFFGPAYAKQRCAELTASPKLVFGPEAEDVTAQHADETISIIGAKPPKK